MAALTIVHAAVIHINLGPVAGTVAVSALSRPVIIWSRMAICTVNITAVIELYVAPVTGAVAG
jgi:hypothetical protein